MLYSEIVSEARRLPPGDQLRLVEDILRAMRQGSTKPIQTRRRRIVPFAQLRGVLRPGGALPDDGELEDAYTRHLLEKYL